MAALLERGGYAQRVAAPATDTVPVPREIPDQVALAMVIQGATAWHLLHTPASVGSGDTVLVSGGGSGVTHLLVQLAQLKGVDRVVVACSGEDKAEVVRWGSRRSSVETTRSAGCPPPSAGTVWIT